jgi:hypothetical protein
MIDCDLFQKWQTVSNVSIKSAAGKSRVCPLKQKIALISF